MYMIKMQRLTGPNKGNEMVVFFTNKEAFYEHYKRISVDYKQFKLVEYNSYNGLKIKDADLITAEREKVLIFEALSVLTKLQYKKCACEVKEDLYELDEAQLLEYIDYLEFLWDGVKK